MRIPITLIVALGLILTFVAYDLKLYVNVT